MVNVTYYDTAYYSDFWYSRYYRQHTPEFGGNLVQDEVKRHRAQLRLLALFFDHIYIPRTHFLTQKFKVQYRIPAAVLDSEEFGYLFERGVIQVSSAPGLDAKEDNERILQRQALTDAVLYPDEGAFVDKIPISRMLEVNTQAEALGNSISFPEYGEILEASAPPHVAAAYLEAVKGAEAAGLPFMHEKFVADLSRTISAEDFVSVWRETNSIYLTGGAPEHGNLIAPFNKDLESVGYRFANVGNIDRYLFCPESLHSFLQCFWSDRDIGHFLYSPIGEVFGSFERKMGPKECRDFRTEFQRIVRRLSLLTRQERLKGQLAQNTIFRLFEGELDNKFEDHASSVNAAIDDATALANAADVANGGVFGTAAKSVFRLGMSRWKRIVRKRKFPNTMRALDAVDLKALKKGSSA